MLLNDIIANLASLAPTRNLGLFNQLSHKPLTWEFSPECQRLPKCINMWQLYLESWAIPREKVQRKQCNQEVNLSTESAEGCSRPSRKPSSPLTAARSKQMKPLVTNWRAEEVCLNHFLQWVFKMRYKWLKISTVVMHVENSFSNSMYEINSWPPLQ